MDSKKCDACGAGLPEGGSTPLCESCMSELHASAGFTDLRREAPAEPGLTLSAAADPGLTPTATPGRSDTSNAESNPQAPAAAGEEPNPLGRGEEPAR